MTLASAGLVLGSRLEVLLEPSRGECNDLFEGARLLEEMRCAGNEFEACSARQLGHGAPVQVNDDRVECADDQQCWRLHVGEGVRGKVWVGRRARRPP